MPRISSDLVAWNLINNPKFFIEDQLYIKTKKKSLQKLIFNEVQDKVYKKIMDLKGKNQPVKIIILKARQTGISTLTEALIFHDTSMHNNVSSLIIAHDKESTQHLFRMSKMFYDRMDRDIRPMKSASNRIELVFENPREKSRAKKPGRNSLIRVDTAGNPDAGRSFTLQNLHISELAMWTNPEEVMTGLMQSFTDDPDTMLVIESTAKGVGNYFYHLWKSAERGDNDFTPIFIAWYELDSYRKELPKDFELIDYDHEVYGNELELKTRFDLDDEQIYWRRYTIKNKCNNDIDIFKQEYPATPDEAFLVSGRNVFNAGLIAKYYDMVSEPERGELDVRNDYKTFVQRSRGELRIWRPPSPKNRYSIGVDVAEGFATGDYSCAEVFDVTNYEQVAEWHGHISQEDFAFVLRHLGNFFNNAIIVVESNQGQVVLSYLKGYSRLYYRRESGMRGEKRTRELGFRTTSRTKDILIADYKKLFEDEELLLNGKELLHEMSVYVEEEPDPDKKKRKLSMGASGKEHDDRVIAACLAIQGLKEVPLNALVNNEKPPQRKWSNPFTRY